VTSAAVRLARAFTGRKKVLCCGYHGWHDWYISVTDRDRGIPEAIEDLSYTFEYNDLAALERVIDDDVACVVLEPVTFEAPAPGFLQGLRALCSARGVVLVFDEMWTGFRIALGGAQAHFGVQADLATFSKAVANGMPLSVLSGRREIMRLLERDVFFFTTYGGEALSLAAAQVTIEKLRDRRVPEHIARLGARVLEGVAAISSEEKTPYVKAIGLPYRTQLTFDPAAADALLQKSFVQQELLRRGVLWNGFHNLSLAHTDKDVDYLLECYREIFALLRDGIERADLIQRLRGEKLEPVFRRTTKFHTRPKPESA
ncbi:MAG TPA: aminotransferase class III-fold pyridoxal phosphate-dependent enzyme, partial [Polyangiales bacterium]